ncbi:bifunctional nicotinamide mononucleotide adenylyltransferase/ADP-ribose pyrophosphatase [compost metagenome]
MAYHIRVRPTALIVQDNQILLVEYQDQFGIHYNLPGGGAEPGETLIEGVMREVHEETKAEVEVGPIAFVYEMAPHHQSGDYTLDFHTVNIIFDCRLKNGSQPELPDKLDLYQTDVKWVPLHKLDSIVLYPNIKNQIKNYVKDKKSIELIEDYMLEGYSEKRFLESFRKEKL